MSAPRVLVSGVVLGQPMGGVRRHNAELLPRAARLLADAGGGLAVMEGRTPVAFELPPPIERLASRVPARPVVARGAAEGLWLRRHLARAEDEGRPFQLVHTAHLPVPAQLSVPFTLTLHDLRAIDLVHNSISRRVFGRWIVAQALERAARVVTVSQAVKGALVERFGVDPLRVAVVPNAADHLEVLPRAPAPDAPILHVGHLEPRKNVELLIRALALEPGLPRLLLAGAAKGEEEHRLRGLALDLGVAKRVEFHGAFDERELPGLYATVACVAVPSLVEGFGLAAAEAQRAGVPLAISRIPALVEVAGEDTPCFDPSDAQACVRALHAALARTPAELEAAREHAARASWTESAERLAAVWAEAAAT